MDKILTNKGEGHFTMDVSPLSTRYPRAEVNNAMQTLTGVRYSHVLQQC